MRNSLTLIVAIVSIIALIVRLSRCNNIISSLQWKSGQEAYFEACQDVLDSTAHVFTPVATAFAQELPLDEAQLTFYNNRMDDMLKLANAIDPFNDEGAYFKKQIIAFIELERGLTCCYLKRYNEEMKTDGQLKSATISNLQSWIRQYAKWRPLYRDERFDYHNDANFDQTYTRLESMATMTHKIK